MWQLESKMSNKIIKFTVNEIDKKLVKLSLSLKEDKPEKVYVIPLIHC